MYCLNNYASEWFSVAIKKPDTKSCYIWNSLKPKNKFEEHDDINKWISQCFSKTSQRWTHSILYNDQLPPHFKEYFEFRGLDNNGHSKGILTWNNKKIGWLIHSIPQYPATSTLINTDYEYVFPPINDGQLRMGQTAVYLEFDICYKESIISQLGIMNVQIYYISDPVVSTKLKQKFNNKTPLFSEIRLKDRWTCFCNYFSNTSILHYAKNNKFDYDIYEIMCLNNASIVSSNMSNTDIDTIINKTNKKTKLLSQTWLNGNVHKLNETNNVNHIKQLIEWNTANDHSKWAISIPKNKSYFTRFKYKVCIGDLNRVDTQLKRSGGCIVIENKKLWKCFHSLIPKDN